MLIWEILKPMIKSLHWRFFRNNLITPKWWGTEKLSRNACIALQREIWKVKIFLKLKVNFIFIVNWTCLSSIYQTKMNEWSQFFMWTTNFFEEWTHYQIYRSQFDFRAFILVIPSIYFCDYWSYVLVTSWWATEHSNIKHFDDFDKVWSLVLLHSTRVGTTFFQFTRSTALNCTRFI